MRRILIRTAAVAAAWMPALALWLAFAMAGGQVSLAKAFPPAALTIAVAALLGLLVWQLCARLPLPEGFRIGFYAIHLLAAAIYSVAWVIATIAAESLVAHTQMWGVLKTPRAITWALTGVWLYIIIAGISYAILGQQRARESERRALRAEAGLSAARLDALQHRLRPHFLFNALHTVAALVRQDSAEAENAIEKLGDMLRYTLQEDVGNTVPFSEEWEFTRRYLDFEQLRYGDRLSVAATIDPACMSCSAPLFALQTLVENAVHHSIALRPGGGKIEITARADDECLFVEVRDDGNGLSTREGTQFGLSALRERLTAVYGKEAKLTVASEAGGFIVSFAVPQDEDADDE
jgi:two-component system, LytTR family, sensor kinase